MAKCKMEYSVGKGTGVAEAIGNWGFSNGVASPGRELHRMQLLVKEMKKLRDPSVCIPPSKPKNCTFKGYLCHREPKNPPKYPPLIYYDSVNEVIPCSNKRLINKDNVHPLFHRSYCLQGTDKWYKYCCNSQPSIPFVCYGHCEVALNCDEC